MKNSEKFISPKLKTQEVDSAKVSGGTKRTTDDYIQEFNESRMAETVGNPKTGRPQKTKLRSALKRTNIGGDGKLKSS